MADLRERTASRFPLAAARNWPQAPAKSTSFHPLAKLPAKKDYIDELQAISKSVTPMSPEQWNSTRHYAPKQQAQPTKGFSAISASLHFSASLQEISQTTSQLAQSVQEALVPLDPDGSKMMSGSEAGEERKEVVVKKVATGTEPTLLTRDREHSSKAPLFASQTSTSMGHCCCKHHLVPLKDIYEGRHRCKVGDICKACFNEAAQTGKEYPCCHQAISE